MTGLVQRWLTVALLVALLDVMTYAVAPRDAWNPLHPHPPHWIQPRPLRDIPLHKVCPYAYAGLGCYYEPGKGK